MRARILNLTFGTHALKFKGQKATFLSLVESDHELFGAWPASTAIFRTLNLASG